jgi:uncharacterized protein YqjF (DUF2071 family)
MSMRLPVIRGVIERRILVNYRVDPDVLARQLPAPFEPQTYRGVALVGICLIRLAGVRPARVPGPFGVRSENAAHRAAVEWTDAAGVRRQGVYIRRRDTNSRFNALVGGRLFPGVHHHARFDVRETAESFALDVASDDRETHIHLQSRLTSGWPANSVFAAREEASAFYAAGSVGYSPAHDPTTFQGLELRCDTWHVEPLAIEAVRSGYFDDETIFPRGSIAPDNALLMRNVVHQWHGCDNLCCPKTAGLATVW